MSAPPKIICTTGTSIANGCAALKPLLRSPRPWEDEVPELRQEIASKLAGLDLDDSASLRRLAAELNVLSVLGLEAGNEVVLLASDTAEGRACAEMLRDALLVAFPLNEASVRICRITGLQVLDARRLREVGLPSLIRTVITEIGSSARIPGQRVILNPTGGFKGVVPFLSLIGMIFGLRTVYIFEFSDALIDLPPLPVTFDLALFLRAKPALQQLLRAGPIKRETYFEAIQKFQPFEEALFQGFIEHAATPGEVQLSPLAAVLAEMDASGPGKIRLSPSVHAVVENLTGLRRRRFELLMARVSQPLWRTLHLHSFPTTDLEVYKQGSVPERIAGITHADAFYVCEYYPSHETYEAELPGKRAARYRLDQFTDWSGDSSPAEVSRLLVEECDQYYQEVLQREERVEELIVQRVQSERLRLEQQYKKAQRGHV